MEIGPILRAITRNKLGVVLIALQIAFTMTVMVNAIFIINERSRMMGRPSGLDEANIFISAALDLAINSTAAIVSPKISTCLDKPPALSMLP